LAFFTPDKLLFKRKALVSLLALTLAACGGGGGGSDSSTSSGSGSSSSDSGSGSSDSGSGSGSTSSDTDVVSSSGTLQTTADSTSYTSGSSQALVFSRLNTMRQGAGAGVVNQDTELDTASAAHAKYLTTNIADGFTHTEDSTKTDYYATSMADRVTKAGFSYSYVTEVIGGSSSSTDASRCVDVLLNTVYHAAALLSRVTSVGIGIGSLASGTPFCVSDLGTVLSDSYGQVPASGSLVGYPYSSQTSVPYRFYVAGESPRPSSTLFPGSYTGTPVIVSVRNADYLNFNAAGTLAVTINQFVLKDSSGNTVSSALLSNASMSAGSGVTLNSDSNLGAGFIVLVPYSALSTNSTYTVTFSATLKSGGTALTKSWSFTTGS
jgi:uncharacterized protein YkwD